MTGLGPDPAARDHVRDLLKAIGQMCAFNSCLRKPISRPGGPTQVGYCPRHAIDEVAVQRAVDGDRSVVLMPHERAAAVAVLARRGVPDAGVADRLGITKRSVERIRADHHIPTSHPEYCHHREDRSA